MDLIFADPPYNLQLQQELWRPDSSRVGGVNDAWDQFTSLEVYDRFTQDWLQACRRVLKDNGTIWVMGSYHNIYRVGAILMDLGYWILNDIVWIKLQPMPNFKGSRFTNAHETLLWAQKTPQAPYTFNYRSLKTLNDDIQMRSEWHTPLCRGEERIKVGGVKGHSTQKPEALLYRVLLTSSNPGDVILDPFFGTGTTGAVAKKLRRHWVGIERDQNYIRIAEQRLTTIQPVPLDFVPQASFQKPLRISFGTLVETGLLQPGQKLYLGRGGQIEATIMVDGHLRVNDTLGSIHQLAKKFLGAPAANGWKAWYYCDAKGELVLIDKLRENFPAFLN